MNVQSLSAESLCTWLAEGKPVAILDIRPAEQSAEWHIPGSIHIDAYDKLKAGDPNALSGLQLDISQPVVSVCAGGKVSQLAAAILAKAGFDSFSLEGGMKAWSRADGTLQPSYPKSSG